VPSAYGTFLIAEMDGGGGLVATAPAVTAFINRNAAFGMGGRAPGAARSGSMPGTESRAWSRGDGIDCCFIFNSRDVAVDPATQQLQADLDAAISAAGI
jgi:hypothetical protein